MWFIAPLLLTIAPPLAVYVAQRKIESFRKSFAAWIVYFGWLLSLVPVLLAVYDMAVAWEQYQEAAVPPAYQSVPYEALIRETARRHGLDEAIFVALVEVESTFKPEAVSYAGAVGLTQLMPDTAAQWGVVDRTDPAQNLEGGAKHLKMLLGMFRGDLELALSAYNMGHVPVVACQCVAGNEQYVKDILSGANRYRRELPGLPYGRNTVYRHTGIGYHEGPLGRDYSAGCGATLVAPLTGVVAFNGFDGFEGKYGSNNSVLIIHGDNGGVVTMLHGDYTVQEGDRLVKHRTVIGREASIGNSSGCHTHFSYWLPDVGYVDPATWVSK